ncbi:MAG: FtsW/RodA/SpoVE family cell cycle protein [Luteitalea sp.]
MRIIDTEVSGAGRKSPAAPTAFGGTLPPATRGRNVELVGLAVCSCVVLLGVWLAVWGRLGPTAGAHSAESAVDFCALAGPAQLAPLLTMFESPAERTAVAERLYRRVTSEDAPIDHVGALAAVTVTAAETRADRRLTRLRTRAAGRDDSASVRVLSSADLAQLKPQLVVRTRAAYVSAVTKAIAWFFAAFWGAHLIRRWRGAQDDPVLLPVLLTLCGIGLMSMVTVRDPLRDALIASTFVSGVGAGLALLLVASEVDYESSPLRRAVLAPLALALLLATLLLVFGTGPGTSGVKVNLLGAQPVEVIRLLVVCAIAGALARRLEFLRELSERPTTERPWLRLVRLPRWRDVRTVVASMTLVLAFFFLQKDLGPALVLSGVVIALYAVARARLAFVVVGIAMLVTGFTVAYAIGFPATVGQRVRIWFDPWNNGVPGGNQIAHGLWAMSTGAFRGSGSGFGSPQSIPEGHTDFVLAAIGEQLGFVGVLAVIGLFVLLAWRCLRIAVRAPGDYSALLAIGITLALVVQAIVIAGGLLGLLPLTGVVTPFLSYGRSSMLANCLAIGVVLAIARRRGPVRFHLRQPVRCLGAVLATMAIALGTRAAWIQVVRADTLATRPSLSEQADGGYRFEYNPRLVTAARAIERGTIYDRHGLVLATSRGAEMATIDASFLEAGVGRARSCAPSDVRCYPLGALAFSVLGDWATQANWAARNSSYLERDRDSQLKGFDDHQRLVEVVNPRTGSRETTVRRDYAALLPIVRHGVDSARADVAVLLGQSRDLHASIDARLQQRVARALGAGIARGSHQRGAAVVLDVATGEVLASVSYPWPDGDGRATDVVAERDQQALLDRVRYGL